MFRELYKYPQVSLILVALALMVAALSIFVDNRGYRDMENPLRDFPLAVGEWHGSSQSMDTVIFDFLNLSDYLLVDYKSDGRLINMYIAYYRSLEEDVFPHSPRKCIPGGGWEIESIDDMELVQREVRRVKIFKDGYNQLVYYWYQQGSDSLVNEYQLKWNTMLRSFSANRTDTSLIRLTTLINPGETEGDADARLQRFVAELDSELGGRFN